MPEGYLTKLQSVVEIEDPGEAFSVALQIDTDPAENAWLNGLLEYPLPFPAGWLADSLGRFDRSFRYAMRSVERTEPVVDLYRRHARLAEVRQGFIIETFEAGSIRLRGFSSDDMYRLLQSKPVVFVGGALTALAILGLNPHLEFGDHAPSGPPITSSPHFVNEPEFRVVINVDGDVVPIRCQPTFSDRDSDLRGPQR